MDYSPMLSTPTLRPDSGAGTQSASGAAAFSTCEFAQLISPGDLKVSFCYLLVAAQAGSLRSGDFFESLFGLWSDQEESF